jgi:hypothetical protein
VSFLAFISARELQRKSLKFPQEDRGVNSLRNRFKATNVPGRSKVRRCWPGVRGPGLRGQGCIHRHRITACSPLARVVADVGRSGSGRRS